MSDAREYCDLADCPGSAEHEFCRRCDPQPATTEATSLTRDPNRTIAVMALADEASFMAAAEKIRHRLADAMEAGIIQTRDVEGVARLSYVLAGDAILAAIGSVEGW